MTVKISPLAHIEIVVRDIEEAYGFLNRVFGAQKTYIKLSESLSGPEADVIHVELGGVVLQFVQPKVEGGNVWADFLREKGPGVHNLTFTVDSIDEAVEAFEAEGVPVLSCFPLDWKKMPGFSESKDTIDKDKHAAHMLGGEEKVGFRFELTEIPPRQGTSPSVPS